MCFVWFCFFWFCFFWLRCDGTLATALRRHSWCRRIRNVLSHQKCVWCCRTWRMLPGSSEQCGTGPRISPRKAQPAALVRLRWRPRPPLSRQAPVGGRRALLPRPRMRRSAGAVQSARRVPAAQGGGGAERGGARRPRRRGGAGRGGAHGKGRGRELEWAEVAYLPTSGLAGRSKR